MRYRPLGRHGVAVSAVSLILDDRPMRYEQRISLIYAALEAGVNTFEVQSRDPSVADALGEALATIDRSVVFVALRIGSSRDARGEPMSDLSPMGLGGAIEAFLNRSRLGRLDVAVLDLPAGGAPLPAHVIPSLEAARSSRRVRFLGVAGEDAVDDHIGTGVFDLLVQPFNLRSDWAERNRLRRATQADMAVIGCDFHPPGLGVTAEDKPAGPLGLGRFLGGRKERTPEAYEFLSTTPGWTGDQICLAYALTEPALATVQTACRDPAVLETLCSVVDRDLPTVIAAQIEMARISADRESAALAQRRTGA